VAGCRSAWWRPTSSAASASRRRAPSSTSFNTVAFTAQAGGGVDFVFGDMFTLGAEAGYLWLAPVYSFGTMDLNGTLLLATFALRFP
jgi:hypothetical protein